ncbi:MAG: C-GCAxxG-C-C family protein [Sulfolobales archaeon]|nr:C-GCAxxG-C-C family protein [Sulfolobales archaeon]MDW8082642.1 C-GCAxxG-C-C family protein [Sulfolobales archaeon]
MSLSDLAEKAGVLAEELHKAYGGCAQMTLRALQQVLGLEDVGVFKAASPLSGGVTLAGEVCGALLGALMAVGLAVGRSKLEPTSHSTDYSRAMNAGKIVFDRFREEFGGVRCRDVHMKLFGRYYNLRDQQEWREFVESGARARCSGVCRVAAKLAIEALSSAEYFTNREK